jgi:hypothetical protein
MVAAGQAFFCFFRKKKYSGIRQLADKTPKLFFRI